MSRKGQAVSTSHRTLEKCDEGEQNEVMSPAAGNHSTAKRDEALSFANKRVQSRIGSFMLKSNQMWRQ